MVFYGFVFYFLVNAVDVIEGLFSFQARGGFWNPFNLMADLRTAGVLVAMMGLMLRRLFVRPQDFAFAPDLLFQPDVRPRKVRDSSTVAAFILVHLGLRLLT